jgi:hypothetical protein
MIREQKILIQHSQVLLPDPGPFPTPKVVLATLMTNISYFGYGLSQDALTILSNAGDTAANQWWELTEPVLMDLTGDNKDMGCHVVYKNFPHEVLTMAEADYWLRQICMYWGLPNALFTTEPEPRPPLKESGETWPQHILHPAGDDALAEIFADLLALPARWIDDQREDAIYLACTLDGEPNLSPIVFKENLVSLGVACVQWGQPVRVETATDVLRLAVGMSEGDVSLREGTKLRRFCRQERRFLLDMLEQAPNLGEDLRRRPEPMKRLLHRLHPGDYSRRYPQVCQAYDQLYHNQLPPTFNSQVEALWEVGNQEVLALLQQRPGELMRRLHSGVLLFGEATIDTFAPVAPKLTTLKLVKLYRYLETINDRHHRTFPPQGNWTKLQVAPNPQRRKLPAAQRDRLLGIIAPILGQRLQTQIGPVYLDSNTAKVKLQTSDSDLLPYGRGTVFPLPPKVTFLRTASYWESGPTGQNIWYDNGWNFFGKGWSPMGACCWSAVKFGKNAALFSGDPTNTKDLQGRACQMIDLYLKKLQNMGVRYAVWNILCYNRIPFSSAREVYAALMWGNKPDQGKLFEPSRCQLSFPIAGDNLTKYVAYLDLQRRELVYLDANLRGSVNSAVSNTKGLSERMPAFVEYLDSLPSVHDLFKHGPQSEIGLPILYSDRDKPIRGDRAWVFKPENQDNEFIPLVLNSLLQ